MFARLLLIAGLTVSLHAGPIVYDYTVGSGGALVSGDTNIGMSCDDCVQTINLPFNVTFYGVSYNSVNVSSNGNLQFNTTSNAFGNVAIPNSFLGATILPFWDDLFISSTLPSNAGTGAGIFTAIHGSGSNRIFSIRFAESACCATTSTPELNFQVLLFENSTAIRFVYGAMSGILANGASATIGVQDGTNATQFSFNTASVSNGTFITFDVNHTNDVPEPSTYSLIGIGGALLAAGRFLRRR